MDRWFGSSRNNERRERGDRRDRRDRGDRTRNGDRTNRVESGSSRRNDIIQETYREQRYRYTGIPPSELARRELEPLERREREDQRQLFESEWNKLNRDQASSRQQLEEILSQGRQNLLQDFEKQNAEVAQNNEESRQDMYGYFQENPLSERQRQKMLHDLEIALQQDEQEVAEDQERRMNTFIENANIRREKQADWEQGGKYELEQDQQRRMNELMEEQDTRRQERTGHYESFIVNFRRVNEPDSNSDELSLPSEDE